MSSDVELISFSPEFTITTLSHFDVQPIHKHEKPYEILINLPANDLNVKRSNFTFKDHQCQIENVRGQQSQFSLDEHGFTWVNHVSSVKELRNRDEIETKYYSEMEALIRKEIGGNLKKVHFFDFRVRVSMDEEKFAQRVLNLDDGLDPLLPALHPHIDQSPRGALLRCDFHLPDEATELLKGRFRIINVWRPLSTIRSWPLAVCQADSVDDGELIPNDLIRRRYIGEALYVTYNEKHKWKYLKDQTPGEVTMLKIYDSNPNVKARYCPHTAFQASEHDTSIPRESLEVRALVFDYPEEEGEGD